MDRVLEYMKKFNMVESGDKIVVGVSGGADSLALLHILNKIKDDFSLELAVAHVHHGLRGEDADKDAKFVEGICRDWQIPFYIKKADVRKLASKWGLSEEEAGRKVRYDFFEQILKEIKGQKIALAHHRDDQAETILYNLIRGTGLKGLQGMKPVREGKIIRPLLQVSRQQIEAYCRENNLEYRIDLTNEENIYTRNRIRNVLIPYIQENFNPNFSENLVRMGDIIREEEEFLSHYSNQLFQKWAKALDGEVRIPIDFFISNPKAISRRVIRLAIEKLVESMADISFIHTEEVLNIALYSSTGSMVDLPKNLKAKKDYEAIVIFDDRKSRDIPSFQYPIAIPGKLYIKELDMEIVCQQVEKPDVLRKGIWCIYIDRDRIQGELVVRNRRDGDRFQPFGMKGTKKLKDYFIDRKIPREERGAIPLVVDDRNIIWVVGHQINDQYKVTQNTKNVLQFKINKKCNNKS